VLSASRRALRVTMILLLAGLGWGLPQGVMAQGTQVESIGIGTVAPEAAGVVLQGPEGVKLSTLRGRVVVVDFWASWCAPCLESMPKLNAMRTRLHGEGYDDRFEVLAVSVDKEVKLARRFLEVRPVQYPVVADPVGISTQNFKVWRLPATYLIDADGRVAMIWYGYGADFASDIEARSRALLAKLH
jgi:thiol-disulfide isomerase/thioredoxin